MDFRCTSKGCGRRFGALVKDDEEFVACPTCGETVDLTEIRKSLAEARRSILDREPNEPSSFTQDGEGDGPAP